MESSSEPYLAPVAILKETKGVKVTAPFVSYEQYKLGYHRHHFLWFAFNWAIAILYVALGAGYSAGRYSNSAENALHLVSNVENHNLRIHGIILLSLAMLLLFGIQSYTRFTWLVLIGITFYSLCSAVLIFLGWIFYPVVWGAPWWYLLAGSLSTLLLRAPVSFGTPGLRADSQKH